MWNGKQWGVGGGGGGLDPTKINGLAKADSGGFIVYDSDPNYSYYIIPTPDSTAYINDDGTGDRRTSITLTTDISLVNPTTLINGTNNSGSAFFDGYPTVVGKEIKFQFGEAKLITEIKFYQGGSQNQGTWKIQGSNNDSDWTDLKSNFILGGSPAQTIDISSNYQYFTYYRLFGVTGATIQDPWIHEFEFKINA